VHRLPLKLGHDIYHVAMTMSWPQFYVAIAALFFVLNMLFAALYQLGEASIANQFPRDFWVRFSSVWKPWPPWVTATCTRKRCTHTSSACWKSSSA
jgi:hypothetical protein